MDAASGQGNGTRAAPPSSRFQNIWRADLVCPVKGPPIRYGAVLTRGARVEAVGPAEEIRPAGQPVSDTDFGAAVLIPGLVNAHTHIELSGLEIEPLPMGEWIVRLVREVREWPLHLFLSSSRLGVSASFEAGVTCVGDISAWGQSRRMLSDMGMRGVVFREVLGLAAGDADSIAADSIVEDRVISREVRGGDSALRTGISPHAPYTASLALYRSAIGAAGAKGWLIATHLAESPEESRFLSDGGGPFAGMHKALDSPVKDFDPPGLSPVRYLSEGDVLSGIDLAVHCNQTGEEEWALLARAGTTVCLCPRSAAFFGHPFADAAGMRRAGVRLCIGTDSRASSPSLSVLEEAVALWEADPALTAETLLEICTANGAEALGFAGDGVGVITPGGTADLAVVVPPPGEPPGLDRIFRPGARVRTTISGGIVRHESGG
jgi:cytosine/adenosine deaminase-related metal-dependent hydrolase